MKLIPLIEIFFAVALCHGCGPADNGDFSSAGNVMSNENVIQKDASHRSNCRSSRWLTQSDGTIEAKTIGELVRLCN